MSTESTPVAGPSMRRDASLPPSSFSSTPRERSYTSPTLSRTSPLTPRPTHHGAPPPTDIPDDLHDPSPSSSAPATPTTVGMRKTQSSTANRRDTETPPPKPPPKDLTSDPLFRAARNKLSSRDQEAMKKLRSTMMEFSDSGSSVTSNGTSPLSPAFFAPASNGNGSASNGLRSRASTLSRQVLVEDTQDRAERADESTTQPPVTEGTSRSLTPIEGITPSYVVAVIGHRGTGKTTIIRRALKGYTPDEPVAFSTPALHPVISYQAHFPAGGKIRMSAQCTFIEVDLDALNIDDTSIGFWPADLPSLSGAVLCYDATRRDTLTGIPEALHYLATEGLPVVMMATKSDPGQALEVDAPYANSLGEPYNIGLIEVTNITHEGKIKTRNGMRWLIYKLEQRFVRQLRKASAEDTPINGSGHIKHLSQDSDASSTGPDKIMWRQGLEMTNGDDSKRDSRQSDKRSSSSNLQWMMKGPMTMQSGVQVEHHLVINGAETSVGKAGPIQETYMSLEHLLNKLFTAIVSTQDEAFVKTFFLTYRRFFQPKDLMRQFLERFNDVESYAVAKDIRHWALQKLTGALIDWTSTYPGDLVDPVTQGMFQELLNMILKHTFMAHLTGELVLIESALGTAVDVDRSWVLKPTGVESIKSSSLPSASNTELGLGEEVLYEFDSPIDKSEIGTPVTKESTPSLRTASSASLGLEPNGQGRKSEAELRLGTSWSNSHSQSSEDNRFSKPISEGFTSEWNDVVQHLMATSPSVFATELTRMQWELFSVIRPRDVFRHDFGKEKDGPVGKAIQFFNHVSRWVSTIILSATKAKHRAKIFERLILVAHQLRRLNNYDTLYAIISGLRETSIHRLHQTHAALQAPPGAVKDYLSHVKLMDPRGGYVLYRRALAEDLSQGRTAIPLLTTIMGLVNRLQGIRPEDIRPEDGFVQWDKFARFGEILSVIPDCQVHGSPVNGKSSSAFNAMINGPPVMHDEDALFERSRMLEPGGPNGGSNVLRRLGMLI